LPVCVVGLAIALAKGLRAADFSISQLIFLTALYTFAGLTTAIARRRRAKRPKAILAALLVACAPLSMLLLAWIGIAAGIH